MTRRAALFLTCLLLGFAPALPAAKPPVLMLLEHIEGAKAVQQKIELKEGAVASKDLGNPRDKWRVLPGDPVTSDERPGDRAVNFYRINGRESLLLFVVKVRYYQRNDGKWMPRFQLNEEPLVARGPDGRWKPFTLIQGVPSLIMQSGTSMPNADGYVAVLELGFTGGGYSLDAWMVR